MELPKTLKLLIVLLVLLAGVSSYLLYRLFFVESFREDIFVTNQEKRQVDQPPIQTGDYNIPLNEVLDEAGATRRQIRGKLTGESLIGEYEIFVTSGDEDLSVKLPDKVRLYCLSETITNASGREVETKDVFLDFTRSSEDLGTLIEGQNLLDYIFEGSELTLQVEVDGEGVMTADLIVGYGCSI